MGEHRGQASAPMAARTIGLASLAAPDDAAAHDDAAGLACPCGAQGRGVEASPMVNRLPFAIVLSP